MLWRKGLLHKLKCLKINGAMFQWIKDFLSNRTFQVKVSNKLSEIRYLENGTPQGSIISPILFLIMINDISTSSPTVKLSLYADDSTAYNSGTNLKFLIKQMKVAINLIST